MLTRDVKDGQVNGCTHPGLTDEQLFLRFRETGNREDFEVLVRRYEREIYGYLRRYLGDTQMAEDTFQATFLTVYRKSDQFEEGRNFRPWLYTIATNKAIDAQRAKKRRRVASLDAESTKNGGRGGSLAEQLLDSRADVQELAADSETRQEVRSALSELNPMSREVIDLVYFRGLKYSEAAEALDIPIGTVRSRLHMAIRKLQQVWERRTTS